MTSRAVRLEDVKTLLALTSTPKWGYQLRRGLIPLDPADVDVLRRATQPDEAR